MESCKPQTSKLFVTTAVDFRDEIEEKFERAYQLVQQVTAGLTDKDKEYHDQLSTLVSKEKTHDDITLGLVYIILTDFSLAPKTYRDLTLLTRDGFNTVIANLNVLVAEKHQKLTEVARKQLLWLIREFVKNQVLQTDTLVWNILRQASGGDISPRNIALVEGLLDIFIEHRPWLEKFPFLIALVVYTYVRLIDDHCAPQFTNLRNKEIKFAISLIRDRFSEIIPLGRDFVRILQNVARIPEFEQLWKDLWLNPKSLCPTFGGIWHLLSTRTSRSFLQSRLTPDVEKKLHFMCSCVKFGNHKRYQDWFQERYFTTPESHSLRSDLIRFIINVIHPTNDMLGSDVLPRWAIIRWLLTSCTNQVALANAKLALFYDWLFFDLTKDNIMNIEPGILLMHRSIKTHPVVSSTLLDFLCRIMKNFCPKDEDKIRTGIHNSFRAILEKRVIVIQDLNFLFDFPKLDRELKKMVRENFREFCTNAATSPVTPPVNNTFNTPFAGGQHVPGAAITDDIVGRGNTPAIVQQTHANAITMDHNDLKSATNNNKFASLDASVEDNDEPKFSDGEDEPLPIKNEDLSDDDDLPLSKVRLKTEKTTLAVVDLPSSIRDTFEKFITTKSIHDFETFLTDYRTASVVLDSEQEKYVHEKITNVLTETTPEDKSIFPESSKNDEKLAESINYPLFAIYKVLFQYEEKCKKCILDLLVAVNSRLSCTGYMLLYFLKVYAKLQLKRNHNSILVFKANVYKLYCQCIDCDLMENLETSLNLMEKQSAQMFFWLLPDIFREFNSVMVNNSEVAHLICACVDAKNLRDIIYNVTQGKLVLFKNEGIIDVIRESLDYETFEQYALWQLLHAHDVPISYYQDILPELEASNHAEALTYLLLLLKTEEPTTELIRLLLSRETKNKGDSFVTSALRYWCQEYESQLAEIIAGLLTSKYPINSPNKRKRPLKNSSQQNSLPTSEQLLNHLEHFRRSCRHGNGTGLYAHNDMQRALQQAFTHSTDSQKKQFSDLFALAAEDDTIGRRGTSSRGRKPPPSKKDSSSSSNSTNSKKNSEPVNNANSSGESSDEDWSKQKTAKRRKKALSDSD